MSLKVDLTKILGTTGAMIKKLNKIGIFTVHDLLNNFPKDYANLIHQENFSLLQTEQLCSVKGILSQFSVSSGKNFKKLIRGKISNHTGSIELVWFNQPYLINNFRNGQTVVVTGKIKFENNKLNMLNPEIEQFTEKTVHSGGLTPIYVENEGISSKWFREKISRIINQIQNLFPENLPQPILDKYQLLSLPNAFQNIHFPETEQLLEQAKNRLAFQEILLLQLKNIQKKMAWQKISPQHLKKFPKHQQIQQFIQTLPYQLTNAQLRVIEEIFADLESGQPMFRLVQGDVGSGKTIVAGIAALNTFYQGYQTAIMAPTEILAEQHYQSIQKLFENKQVNIKLLTGSISAQDKKKINQEIASGEANIVIGTHALIQESVKFYKLGLAVIDEQHRFGVLQRDNLKKNHHPHLLSLSATPIPRTMAMTIYGDHDLSIIDEMPKGRIPIITRIVPEKKRKDAYAWIRDRIQTGRQAFVVCPLIEESETLELKSVQEEFEKLQYDIFPDLRIGMLHGKMSSEQKEGIMTSFKNKELDILVSTSVIEVGIDIPNASIILIEGAERFGLSQLHQFRGRVGRGSHQSYCFLFMQQYSQTASQRLKAMVAHNSGFDLAEIDLKLRGAGQIFGLKQSGLGDLKIADLSDLNLINEARSVAKFILEKDPELELLPELKKDLEKIKQQSIES